MTTDEESLSTAQPFVQEPTMTATLVDVVTEQTTTDLGTHKRIRSAAAAPMEGSTVVRYTPRDPVDNIQPDTAT